MLQPYKYIFFKLLLRDSTSINALKLHSYILLRDKINVSIPLLKSKLSQNVKTSSVLLREWAKLNFFIIQFFFMK